MEQKIFCVGFNKTGTSTLHMLFQRWGIKSLHRPYNMLSYDDHSFLNYQCFCDGEHHDFKGLDKAFKGSKFILTTRKLDDWLVSRIKWMEYRRSLNKEGWMRKEYEGDSKTALQNWIRGRVNYNKGIKDYFLDREGSFMKVNICDCEDQEKLINSIAIFLNIDSGGIKKFNRTNMIAQRKRNNLIYRFKTVFLGASKMRNDKAIRKEVNSALRLSGLPESEWYSDGFSSS